MGAPDDIRDRRLAATHRPHRRPLRTAPSSGSETWIACRFLATAGGEGLLEFPLRVEPGERPDLVVTMPSGSVGIEITEAVPKDGAKVDAYSEHKEIDECRFIPRYRVGDAPRSRAEIEKIARGNVRQLPRMQGEILFGARMSR